MKNGVEGPWVIGKKMFIRTVTMHLAGEIAGVYEHELVLVKASWIADSGRLSDFLRNHSAPDEVEMFVNPVIVGRASVVDATEIGDLPSVTR